MIITFPKGSRDQISDNFTATEFDCPCTSDECIFTLVDDNLVEKLESMRRWLGAPILITSGYRCAGYQADLKKRGYETAKGVSTHQKGMAADVRSPGHDGAALAKAARKAGFWAVGIAKTFAHCDTRGDKRREWQYS